MDELYAKENNLLQLSLFFFGKGRPEKMEVKWSDEKGNYKLGCICKYGVPGSFDQDVYTAAMRIWVDQGMPEEGIILNYSDIARELNLKPKDWVTKIKKSLKKLAQARYEFTRCFISVADGEPKKIDTHFSLFDSASLFEYRKGERMGKKNSESKLRFPKEIRDNLEAKYYQLLNMAWYRSFPSGLPRRLYEYLEKRRYHNIEGSFKISEEAICRWLPITDKNRARRLNRLGTISEFLIGAGYLTAYEFDKKKKQCKFTYAKDTRPRNASIGNIVESKVVPSASASITTVNLPIQENAVPKPEKSPTLSSNDKLDGLCNQIKLQRIPATLKAEVLAYAKEYGLDYVRRNILYTNQKAKRAYSSYLLKALANDWGAVWAEEQEIKQEKRAKNEISPEEAIRQAEEWERKEKEKKLNAELEKQKQRELFKQKLAGLEEEDRQRMKEEAKSQVPQWRKPGQGLRMKVIYNQLVFDFLAAKGEIFSKDILSLDLAAEIWE